MLVSRQARKSGEGNVVLTMLVVAAKFAISPPLGIGAASTPVRVAPKIRTDAVVNFIASLMLLFLDDSAVGVCRVVAGSC